MKNAELRSANLTAALERAVAGKPDDLFRQLEMQSGLPGPRVNTPLAVAFANDCARYGAKVDALVHQMASFEPIATRGAADREFITMCGVLATAARAILAKEDSIRDRAVELVEARAEDTRFRVRDSVPLALAMLGSKMKGELAARVEPWMDRYYHAAAVIRALADPLWLETFEKDDASAPIELLHSAFILAHDAPSSADRYPGHKALVEALGWVPGAFAKRFGIVVFDRLMIWAEGVKKPELRDAILKNVDDAQLKKPFTNEIKKLKAAVEGSKKPPRDPTKLIAGMRSRGKKHQKR